MRQVRFSVQSLAYDTKSKKLIGEKALKDISKGVIRINNKRNYEWAVAKYGEKVTLKTISKKLNLKSID